MNYKFKTQTKHYEQFINLVYLIVYVCIVDKETQNVIV